MSTAADWIAAHTSHDWPPVSHDHAVWDRILEAECRYSAEPAIVQIAPSGQVARSVTYGELVSVVRRRCQTLGDAKDRRVAVAVRNDIDSVVDVLAVLAAEATVVLVDADQPAARREEQTRYAAELALEGDGLASTPTGAGPYGALEGVGPGFEREAFVLFTTGSTASQKAVIQSQRALLSNVLATAEHHSMQPGEVMACALPISHVNGLHFGVLAPLLTGGSVVLFEAFSPLAYLPVLARHGACRATTVPSLLRSLLHARWPVLPAMRYFVSAAAPLSSATALGVDERSGLPVVQGYGLSETMNFATTMPTAWSADEYRAGLSSADILPVGIALRGLDVRIETPDGVISASSGARGEVLVRGDAIMNGYLGEQALTAEAFAGGWFHTGDLGMLSTLTDGRVGLQITGRIKNIAACGGLKVSLEEVDRWLLQHAAVADCCSIAVEHDSLGESVSTYVVLTTKQRESETGILDHLAARFNPAAIGFRMVSTEKIPTLRSGKVDRLRLRESWQNS